MSTGTLSPSEIIPSYPTVDDFFQDPPFIREIFSNKSIKQQWPDSMILGDDVFVNSLSQHYPGQLVHTNGEIFSNPLQSESEPPQSTSNVRPADIGYFSYWLSQQRTQRLVKQAIIDHYTEFQIYNGELANVIAHEFPRTATPSQRDYQAMRPFFGSLSVETIKRTFSTTSQNLYMPPSTKLQRRFKS